MDPQQTAALNALAPFLALSPSATSPRAAADLISQAIAAQNTYVFAELLQTPNIQSLRNAEPQHARWFKVLEIFCWGTWTQYQEIPDLPPLSEPQATKLRLLTLLTLAQSPYPQQTLTYPSLLQSLSLPSTTALSSLLTTAIYASLLTAKLNPLAQRVDLVSVAPLRDLAPGSVPQLAGIFDRWEKQCRGVLKEVENKMAEVREKAEEREKSEAIWRDMVDEGVKNVEKEMGVAEGKKESGGVGVGVKREGGDLEEEGAGIRRARAGDGGVRRALGAVNL